MSDLVTLTIDGVEVSVPKGTVVVDAAKKIGNDIPVFCYHPKLEPVGMCRMCLVEIGVPVIDRATGEPALNEDGSPKLNFGKGLQTGCTVQVSPGMVVRTNTIPVTDAREDIIEFILTSHPLDCPICDKGGECPLQNQTMEYGKGTSRMVFSDKLKLDKHVPLGDLIYLDRERCIQCGRCVRFQDEIADDPVLEFHNRGRRLEIATLSDPGFDSYWSGNTTDICPVGALTSSDFRFGARPWELTPAASVCNHCPVGCNTTMSTRREAIADGRSVIKRIMPRQNESVNEIWICDKGRFVHHYADSPERLTQPLVRKDGELVPTSWDEALDIVAGRLQMSKDHVAGVAGGRLSNEDLFMFQRLLRKGLNSNDIDLANPQVAGGDVAAQVGLSQGSNLGDLGAGDAILVVAADLHEQAPVWWLRVKEAAERGATLIVLNARPTRLDKFAALNLHYRPGDAVSVVSQIVTRARVDTTDTPEDAVATAAESLINANNLVAFYGAEGLSYDETDMLARLLGNLLLLKGSAEDAQPHAGRVNNGLIAVWPEANTQGAWDMGVNPAYGPGYSPVSAAGRTAHDIYAGATDGSVKALYVLGADPIGDGLLADRGNLDFLVVQELFLSETALQADVVLPAQSWAEREGTFTSGERRVQRYYPAIPPVGDARADWLILGQLGERIGLGKPPYAASLVFRDIAKEAAPYKEMDYRTLAHVEPQWPIIGREDLYYGGTAYDNNAGLGQQWAATAESDSVDVYEVPAISREMGAGAADASRGELVVLQIPALYTADALTTKTPMLTDRLAEPALLVSDTDAATMDLIDGDLVVVDVNGNEVFAVARVNDDAPLGVAMLRGVRATTDNAPAMGKIAKRPVMEAVAV
ncbi:MAG: NADH-quinone oxidoreductase subunit NuoG [Chloroflexota bacterium]